MNNNKPINFTETFIDTIVEDRLNLIHLKFNFFFIIHISHLLQKEERN